MCGKKVEIEQVIPSISDTWKEKIMPKIPDLTFEKIQVVPDTLEGTTIAEIPPIKHEEVLIRKKTNKKKQKFCPNCNALVGRYSEICKHCGYKLITRCPICGDYFSPFKQHICKELKRIVIREEKEERQVIENSLTETEEKQPVPPILDVKKEKSKVINYFCKFCGIKLNKKATFCPQCGTRVKKK
jgi:rubrerythrin